MDQKSEITAAVHTYNDRYITAGNREKTLLVSSDPANTLNLVWNLAAHPSDCEDLSIEPPPTTIPPGSAKAETEDSDDTDEEPQISCVPKRKPRQLTSEEYDEWLKEQDDA